MHITTGSIASWSTNRFTSYRSAVLPKLDHTNTPLASAAEHDTLSVTRIRYEKDYLVVRVKLADGRVGICILRRRFPSRSAAQTHEPI